MKKIKLMIIALVALTLTATVWAGQGETRPDDKSKEIETELARDPNNLKLIRRAGWTYFYQARQGDAQALDKAIQTFERGAALAPMDSEFASALGISNFMKIAFLARSQAGRDQIVSTVKQTLAAFERAIERAPDDATLLAAHGTVLTILAGFTNDGKTLMKGVEEMNRAVSANPKQVHPRLFRGFTHLNLPAVVRDQKAAVEDLNAILAVSRASYNEQAQGVLRVMLGDLYFEAKDTAKAESEYKAAAGLSSPPAEQARARLELLKRGEPDAKAFAAYRANVINCAICHTNQN
ncbi:MAG TPA: hypothetical protein VKA70_20490 [Blastocatellia bacterium]|nr:hypothetical protein [Blastocatellia bacterium]